MTWRILLLTLALASPTAAAPDVDEEGCRDHPMLSRMPRFHITACQRTAPVSAGSGVSPSSFAGRSGRLMAIPY